MGWEEAVLMCQETVFAFPFLRRRGGITALTQSGQGSQKQSLCRSVITQSGCDRGDGKKLRCRDDWFMGVRDGVWGVQVLYLCQDLWVFRSDSFISTDRRSDTSVGSHVDLRRLVTGL